MHRRSRAVHHGLALIGLALVALVALALPGGCARPRASTPAPADTARPPADSPLMEREAIAALVPGPPRPWRSGAYLFTLVEAGALSVAVAGSFNGWVPSEHFLARRSVAGSPDSLWYGLLPLPRGRHAYKYLIDGRRWIADPSNRERTGDGGGGEASVVVVP